MEQLKTKFVDSLNKLKELLKKKGKKQATTTESQNEEMDRESRQAGENTEHTNRWRPMFECEALGC